MAKKKVGHIKAWQYRKSKSRGKNFSKFDELHITGYGTTGSGKGRYEATLVKSGPDWTKAGFPFLPKNTQESVHFHSMMRYRGKKRKKKNG